MAVAFDQLSPDQVNAVEQAVLWYQSRSKEEFRIFGAAGTGKTTVAKHVLDRLGAMTQPLAPTNRAASILRQKGVHNARTIHSVLFQPTNWCLTENHMVNTLCINMESKHDHGVRFFKRVEPPEGVECFTIDEASMVGKRIRDDIAMFGIKTLVIGDPYQLPPVGDEPGYTSDIRGVELDTSHRFDSMSDIAQLANIIRMSSSLSEWHRMLPYIGFEDVGKYDLLLAWRNTTRWSIINTLRALRGLPAEMPTVGDRLISVANTYEVNILNAQELRVAAPPTPATHMGAINIPTVEAGVVTAWLAGFRDLDGEMWAAAQARRKGAGICALTFSEAMTVHKAQGGEWENVLVVDDLPAMSDQLGSSGLNTWAYTAVTRASEKIDFIKIGEFPTGMRLRRMMAAAGA